MFDGRPPLIERRHRKRQRARPREMQPERQARPAHQQQRGRPRTRNPNRIIMQKILSNCLSRPIVCIFILIVSLQFNARALLDGLESSNASAPFATSQSVSGNMSSMMLNQTGPTMMTNTSLVAAHNNKTAAHGANLGQPVANKSSQSASAKGPQSSGRQGAAPTNSPAFISRLKQSASQGKHQVDAYGQQARSGKRTDNQMAADSTQANQAFMSVSSGTSAISEPSFPAQSSPPSKPQSSGAEQTSTNKASTTIEVGAEPVTRLGEPDSSMLGPAPQRNAAATPAQPGKASATANWQPAPWMATATPATQWRPKSSSRTYQAQYDSPATQQRYTGSSADQLAEADGLPVQLEKPGGYSYESGGSYTHTSPLSPARQEVQLAEQVGLRQRHRQQSFYPGQQQHYYYDRSGHSSAMFDTSPRSVPGGEQLGGAGKSPGPQHLEQFHAVQQQLDGPGSGAQAGRPASAGGPHAPYPPFSMMPVPHLTITGTSTNPCKPLGGGAGHELGQSSIQIMAGESAQALPHFSGAPKYQRAGYGTRLRSQYIFKVIRADSLTDCELACSRSASAAGNNPADLCRSFNYRAHFAAENCELSRHEVRSLKLEDSAQFEQNTQFDFYALETPAPATGGLSSGALMAAPSGGSLAYSPFAEADCLDVSQSCSPDGMEFSLRTSEPFNGRIYTYGFYDSCFTDGEGSTTSVLRVTRSNGFPRCGTQQIGDLMTNIVVVQFNDYVQTTRDKKYNLTCYFSGPGEAVVTSNYLDTKIDERSHPIQIEHLPPQNVVTSNVHLRVLYRGQPTNTIAVGDLLTFRLETRSLAGQQHRAEAQNEIFAFNVLAKDPYSGRQVQLIDARGCPIDPTNVFPELQRTPDGALESEFYAFKIPDSNFLIFQATVRTCKAPCEPVICQTSGGQAAQQSGALLDSQRGQYLPAPVLAGVKGGLQYQLQRPLQQVQLHSVPSWGRRRRRWTLGAPALEPGQEEPDSEVLSSGETVEHVIPVRMGAAGEPGAPRAIKTLRRPELGEAEEEVKEMFRVYLSRAEIERQQQRQRQQQQQQHLRQQQLEEAAAANWPSPAPLYANHTAAGRPSNGPFEHVDGQQRLGASLAGEQVCLTQSGYYIMLFTVVALSGVLLAVLLVSLYITRKAKFHLSDAMSDAIF